VRGVVWGGVRCGECVLRACGERECVRSRACVLARVRASVCVRACVRGRGRGHGRGCERFGRFALLAGLIGSVRSCKEL